MPRQKGAKTAPKPPQYRWLSVPRMRIVPEISLPRLLTQKSDQRLQKIDQVVPVLPAGMSQEDAPSEGVGTLESHQPAGQYGPAGKAQNGGGGGLSVSARIKAQQYHVWLGGAAGAAETCGQAPKMQEEEEQVPSSPSPGVPEAPAGNCEFMRRRRAHPRLRWPRLASRNCATGAAYTAGGGTGIVRCKDCKEDQGGKEEHPGESDRQHLAHPESSFNSTPVVLGMKAGSAPGSVTGSSVALGSKLNNSSSISETVCSTARSAGSMARSQKQAARPAILPRARTHRPVEAGTSSTLNAPLPEDAACSRPSTSEGRMSSLGLMTPSPSTQLSSQLSRVSSTATKTSSCDRKWFMRVAPISCLPAERSMKTLRQAFASSHPEHNHGRFKGYDDPSLSGDYLSFERWGLNDDYIEALLCAHDDSDGKIRLRAMKHLNLSENQLTERGVAILMEHGMPESLLSLNLSSNLLREKGGLAVVELLSRCRHLIELNLEGNLIGDLAAEELCNILDHQCPQLEGLGLAQCNIGGNLRGGVAIGNYLSLAHQLTKLDLHWNSLHGEGARALLKGVYANGVENSGKLTGLNLAWNRLGSGTQPDCAKKREAGKVAKVLSSVFQDGQTLFHLDLSYNGIDAEDCAVLAGGLMKNHTLFGIHLIGNEATLDDYGFVVPLSRKQSATKESSSMEKTLKESSNTALARRGLGAGGAVSMKEGESYQQSMNNLTYRGMKKPKSADLNAMQHNPSLASFGDGRIISLSDDDVCAERKWIRDHQRVKSMLEWTDCEAVQRNSQCCWICENWVEHKVTYTPGVSGDETTPGQVQSIYALYSIDGFMRPTHLSKQEEMFTRRSIKVDSSKATLSMPAHEHRLSYLSEETVRRRSLLQGMPEPKGSKNQFRKPVVNSHGRLEKWVGIRMLPPTLEPLEVIFVVNDKVRVLDDLEKKMLTTPKTINLVRSDEESQVESIEIRVVNVVPIGPKAWEKFRQGMEIGICIMEDPENRGDLTILPRKLTEMTDKAATDLWTFETSTFREFARDTTSAVDKCFDMDWQHSRVPIMVKNEDARIDIYKSLRFSGQYLPFILTFWNLAYSSTVQHRSPAGVSLTAFRNFLLHKGGEGPHRVIDGVFCKVADPDAVFCAANVVPVEKRARFKLLPEKALARFQFFEAIVRIGFRRYLGTSMASGPQSYRVAIEALVSATRLGQELVELRRSLHRTLFTEECCQVYKEYLDILKVVFEGYAMIRRYSGRSGKMMSFGAWTELLVDTGVMDSGQFTHEQIGVAFSLGKEIRADEYSSWRFMELSWAEFTVALGAVVRLSPAYKKEIIADLLDEFFNEHVEEAHSKVLTKRLGTAHRIRNLDAQMAPLVRFLEQLFQDADEDCSGSVDQREFRDSLARRHHLEEMESLGLNIDDIDMLFRMVDKDGSGDITLDELVDGFIKMKVAMRGEERAIQFIRDAFSETDVDGSGTLDSVEFQALLTRTDGIRRLATLGVTDFDITCIFDLVDQDGSGTVTVEQVIEGLLRLRDPEYASVRGIRLLQQLFEDAEEEGTGALTKASVLGCFNTPEVVDKFKKLALKIPPWGVLFEELDVDGSGDLSWEEIDAGMRTFWEK